MPACVRAGEIDVSLHWRVNHLHTVEVIVTDDLAPHLFAVADEKAALGEGREEGEGGFWRTQLRSRAICSACTSSPITEASFQ